MQQYFENRTLKKVAQLRPCQTEDSIILANERPDKNWKSEHYIIHNSTFAKIGLKEARFQEDDLKFNAFIDCYFKKTYFENVNFTGCVFINCNFDEVAIVNCVFDYCKFENCIIEYKYLKESLSNRPNIRWELCKELSLECLKLGNEEDYRKYFFEEKKASEEYYFKKFWHSGNDKYLKKYNGTDRLSGLFHLCMSKLNKILWGYGEKISRLLGNVILTQFLFVPLYFFTVKELENGAEMSWAAAIYISLCNFLTVTCDYNSSEIAYKILSVAESGVGIILMGFFVAALFRFINRRG